MCGLLARALPSSPLLPSRLCAPTRLGFRESLEALELRRPHLVERRGQRPEGLAVHAVDAAPALLAHAHEAGGAQASQVLGHRAEADLRERVVELARAALAAPELAHEGLAARLGDQMKGTRCNHIILVPAKMMRVKG